MIPLCVCNIIYFTNTNCYYPVFVYCILSEPGIKLRVSHKQDKCSTMSHIPPGLYTYISYLDYISLGHIELYLKSCKVK